MLLGPSQRNDNGPHVATSATMDTIRGYGTSQMPLAGAILCCTSIPPEQRTALAQIGAQMGATIKLDLTSDVTHLVVGNINSAKYRYVAKSREDVKVLAPEWLEALRTVWMEGEDVNVVELEDEYRLPTFFGLKICLTGFDNPDQRKYIQESVVHNGAEYHGDLTKNVTHLIAAKPSGKKYEHAVNWKMKIISYEWFQHSLERGMSLDEACFHPTKPEEERGKGAWDRRPSMSPTLGKHAREVEQSHTVNPHRRKLRRSASSRMGSQSEALWAGITAAGLERKRNEEDDWQDENFVKPALPRDNVPSHPSAMTAMHEDGAQPGQEDTASQSLPQIALPSNGKTGIFEGRVVFAHGFDEGKTNILREVLTNDGAIMMRDASDLENLSADDLRRSYLIIPHDAEPDLTSLPGGAGAMHLVTNWWVERCLHTKCLVDPTGHVLCRPFDKLSISGFNGLTVSSTAFTGIELLHVTKVIPLMGESYDEFLTPKTSVIVCNTHNPNQEKLKFATEKRVPAVHANWLWECLRTSEFQPYDAYLLNTITPSPQITQEKHENNYTEVPTAPLSEEDSAKLRKKKAHAAKPPSKPRNGSQRPRTLDLALSADPTPLSTTGSNATTQDSNSSSTAPFTGTYDAPAPLPLQNINPGVNSPRRPSTSSNASSTDINTKANSASTSRYTSTSDVPRKPTHTSRKSKFTKEPSPDSVIPPPSEPVLKEKDYSSLMSELLTHRKAAAEKNANHEPDKRRRHRQLGRATSTRSNPSTAGEIDLKTSSLKDDDNDGGELNLVGKEKEGNGYQPYQPSQELGWEPPGVQESRPMGVVRDVVSTAGGLPRMGRRKR
ncbi:uncharacterized protein BDR25DRAFT_289946 [Lindgomyces ingoldianus]|uniref:Uncharacterized protein n=1 Tax=Lindgomyces ingoldianus TaxID=673940 RepID=A0ACB6QPQ5_9PLEO|nr:uncharacterized protein BDR25DRAFT_289946 [Lindgomyces ingoldianus]KAF2468948.1 hypothetical protein BDR25DRAFT_289946 [Lindgomyces ingoldianus]